MNQDLELLIDEAIELEINMMKLYTLFKDIFPEDAAFWGGLVGEERNHVVLLKKIKSFLSFDAELSDEFLSINIENIKETNEKVSSALIDLKQNANRDIAYKFAYEIENSASELHYQYIMDLETDSKLAHIFQQLNFDDNDHARRINEHILSKN